MSTMQSIITVPKIQDCNTLAEINNNRANSENSISHNYIEDELTKPNEVPYRKPKMKRQKPIQQQSVSKNRLKENTNKYVQNQRVVRRKSVEEISHTFQQPMTKLSRHTKSTSNLLELKDDESKSSSSFMTRIRKLFKKREIPLGPGPLENKVFGNSLAILEISSEVPNVPLIVVACIKRLEEEDMIITHGLYRASGNKITIDELKKKIDDSSSKSLKRYDCLKDQEPNTIAGLLKQFFRELEPGLIKQEIALKCINNVSKLNELKKDIDNLDIKEKSTLKYLIQHLDRVSNKKFENKMDSNNLSIVWGPCIFKSMHSVDAIQSGMIVDINRVVKELIDNCKEIFE